MTVPTTVEAILVSDELSAAITKTAAARAAEPRTLRLVLALALLGAAGAVVLFVLWLGEHQQTATLREQTGTLSSEVDGLHGQLSAVQAGQVDAAAKSQALYDQVTALGKTPVVSAAVPGPGPAGPAGTPGVAGRGVAGTAIRDGHLVLFYSDGSSTDVGQVAGAPGVTGVSISTALIVGGHLTLTYSDGHSVDVGQVVGQPGINGATGETGKPGRSVVSTVITNGHLVVGYDDGTTQDAGPLPVAPAGRPPAQFTFTDVTGRTYTCTPDTPPDPGTSPNYTCQGSKP